MQQRGTKRILVVNTDFYGKDRYESPATLELLVSLRSSEASSRFLSVPLLHSRSVDRQSAIASS
jgi:hypothetical protein